MKVKDLIYLLMSKGEMEDEVWFHCSIHSKDGCREILAPSCDSFLSVYREGPHADIKDDLGQFIIHLGEEFEDDLQTEIDKKELALIKDLDPKLNSVKKKVKKK